MAEALAFLLRLITDPPPKTRPLLATVEPVGRSTHLPIALLLRVVLDEHNAMLVK